jgi:DNA-binding NtrC family response regulator
MGEHDAILVVDADHEAALHLSDFLEREGYSVAVAATGGEGLRRVHQERFALVLIDLELPDIDPARIVTEAGRAEAPPEVIVVTGRATVDSAIQAVESRSAGYIVKPVDLVRLGAIVARVFERRRLALDNARLNAELTERLAESEALAAISATVSSCPPPPIACPRSICRPSRRPRCRSRNRAFSSPCGPTGGPSSRTTWRWTRGSRIPCSGASRTSRACSCR